MSNGQNSTFSELVPYCFLDQLIRPTGTQHIHTLSTQLFKINDLKYITSHHVGVGHIFFSSKVKDGKTTKYYCSHFLFCTTTASEAESAVPGVHVGCGLVDDEDAVLPQDGSGQTHQLPLAHAEVGAWLGQNRLQLTGQLLHRRLQLDLQGTWTQRLSQCWSLHQTVSAAAWLIGARHEGRQRSSLNTCAIID